MPRARDAYLCKFLPIRPILDPDFAAAIEVQEVSTRRSDLLLHVRRLMDLSIALYIANTVIFRCHGQVSVHCFPMPVKLFVRCTFLLAEEEQKLHVCFVTLSACDGLHAD